jgi:hypothetical protein
VTDASGGSFVAFVEREAAAVEHALRALLPAPSLAPVRLHEAMHYALFPGGKRLRPMLTLLGCAVTGGDRERALRPAAALECLHTYSLVHDDLPCMDDDDLRRGRPTLHKHAGEAMAILAGDSMLGLAFELLCTEVSSPRVIAQLCRELSIADCIGHVLRGAVAPQDECRCQAASYERCASDFLPCPITLGEAAQCTNAMLDPENQKRGWRNVPECIAMCPCGDYAHMAFPDNEYCFGG